jgi:imidazolonepropionase-like amidohydrolase
MDRSPAPSFDCRCPHVPLSAKAIAAAEAMFDRRAFLAGALATVGAVVFPRLARAADGSPQTVTVLRAARLFDGETMHAPGVLVFRGDRIVSMSAGDAGSDAKVVELGDVTLMPGLIDAHTHVAAGIVTSTYLEALARPNAVADSIAEAALLSIGNATAMLANGFTTIRDVGGGAGIDLAMRNAIARGAIVGPRIIAAGTALSITGGHGDANDMPDFVHVDDDYRPGTAYGPYGFREQVREHVKRHVDLIKITATGGVLSYGDTFDVPQLNLDEIQAVVDESTKFGRKVAAHCHGDKGIALAVAGGCHSIEHCTGVGEATLHEMQQRGTYLVPTIWALDSILQPGNPNRIPQNSLDKAEAAAVIRNAGMQRALGTGVKIAYGTDAGVFPHKENAKDFALLQSMGMRPLDLMKSATSVASELLGTPDRGRLAPGKLADVVAFAGDPSRDAALLGSKPSLVVLGGKRIA